MNPPTHDLIDLAIDGLARMEHRGGSLDGTGDGAGLLLRPERSFFEPFLAPGRRISDPDEPLVVGCLYFLHGERNIPQYQREVDTLLRRKGLAPLGWRQVPTNPDALGARARLDVPTIYQVLVGRGHRPDSHLTGILHETWIEIEAAFRGLINVVSLAPHATVYKVLGTAEQLAAFYPDLQAPALTTRLVLGHRRFSTNTLSSWHIVQPFRHLAHNGEVNTITANCRAIRDAASALSLPDALMNHGSDSAQMDRVAEMLAVRGMSGLPEALRRMIPPAWEEMRDDPVARRFFEANRRAMGTLGAWEGPIGLVATDGETVTAVLDRMGLRPLRWYRTAAGRLAVASEAGALPHANTPIDSEGQLEPGAMLVADLNEGTLIPPGETDRWVVERSRLNFENLAEMELERLSGEPTLRTLPVRALNVFGWTRERKRHLLAMMRGGKEPVYSMGNDSPLAIFSENHSLLYGFLHQVVAVVTNPPIDPYREGGAMDTTTYLGRTPRASPRSGIYQCFPQYRLPHPVLTNEQVEALHKAPDRDLQAVRLDATFADGGVPEVLSRRIHALVDEALARVQKDEVSILILSDYEATRSDRLPLPMLLTVSAIHQALAAAGLRREASLVVETGEVREGHDCAVLLAYGASAVNPYAMFHIVRESNPDEGDAAITSVIASIEDTIRRVMAKMGITSLSGYRGSALFEAVGLSPGLVDYYLPDTVSRLGGLVLADVYRDIVARAAGAEEKLAANRNVTAWRREVTDALQRVARNGNREGDYEAFVRLVEETPPIYLRDALEFHSPGPAVPADSVASTDEVVRTTIRGAAMSHGALNATAHRAIAAAFNHFGSFSNSGEGGEDDRRNPGGAWEEDRSRTRQVASGRFGVDAAYLRGADEIEVKIGQGAKPGEGGHLPANKVTAEIAALRKTRPGIVLISPPPHHDIYSIEDLKQLIHNLRQVHPAARISVKVPSITNLGTIGVGVAKAGADAIVVSGFAGGTGAALSSSISHAGLPLERGLSELHQALVETGIRSRVRIRADGGIKTGTDIALVMALGADEVAVGTPLLVAECCVFCRGCNRGKCPEGIAAPEESEHARRFMRKRLEDVELSDAGRKLRHDEARNGVIRYLECVADDLRRTLARLGLRHPRDLVGRVDLLRQRTTGNRRWDRLDLTELLLDYRSDTGAAFGIWHEPRHAVSAVNERIVEQAEPVLSGAGDAVRIPLTVTNETHAVGATLAGRLAAAGASRDGASVHIEATGYAGQGFGFAAVSGMQLRLEGGANDTVGEAMSGTALISVRPGPGRPAVPHLVGNAAAYGATGGTLLVAGRVGQRFGVRNSGATLVCEGAGQYAFEYMTGGIGVVLGDCGPSIGSGMTDGDLFLWDPEGRNRTRLAPDVTVSPERISDERWQALRGILAHHRDQTGSPRAAELLAQWEQSREQFVHVVPRGEEGP